MELWWYAAIVAAGFVCGVINTLAGSGSLVTLPLLIFLGLPAPIANGTNRVAILLQNVVGVTSFHRGKMLDFRRGKWLVLPAALGAWLGASLAVNLDERMMRLAIGAIMIVMLAVILFKPDRWLKESGVAPGGVPRSAEWVTFFAIGVYGGFIQAGVGIFLLAALVLVSGYDLVRANAVKLLVVLGFTVIALTVFIWYGQVNWMVGLWMALGNMLGAWVAARAAIEKGAAFVRWVLVLVVAVSAIKLLFDALTG